MKLRIWVAGGVLVAGGLALLGAYQEEPGAGVPGIPSLIDRLGTRDWEKAVDGLVGIGEPAVGPLVEALGRSDRFIPGRACIALARIGTPAAVEAVYHAFRDPGIRRKDEIIDALAHLRTETSEDLLIDALDVGALRGAASRVLGDRGSHKAVPRLIWLLGAGAWYEKEAAARALGSIGSPAAIPALLGALEDETRSVHFEARAALSGMADTAVTPLREAFVKAPPDVRWQIVWVLGRIAAPEVPAFLIDALRDPDEMVRWESAVTLARLKVARMEEPLIKLLSDANPRVRQEAAWVLGEIGTESSVSPLVMLLQDKDAGWMAASALGRLGSLTSVGPLAKALRTGPARTRRAAAFGLSRLSFSDARTALARAVRDEDAEVSFWAELSGQRTGLSNAARAAATMVRDAPGHHVTIPETVSYEGRIYPVYPRTANAEPALPSPWKAGDGGSFVVGLTVDGEWAVVPVMPLDEEDARRQTYVDAGDFVSLAVRGLQSGVELGRTRTITGRSVSEITDLARPGGLSTDGFMAEREDILGILAADDRTVSGLALTHPMMARPLLSVWNMMRSDLARNVWNMAAHRWNRYRHILYNGNEVALDAMDTKGVQRSIFEDGLEGYFGIEIRRRITPREEAFLATAYGHLPAERLAAMKERLSVLNIGEMEAYYIQWYGFYEGHTAWRADPLAIAFIFGLKSIEDMEEAFPGALERMLAGEIVAGR